MRDAYIKFVAERDASSDDVEVTACWRVKRASIDGGAHLVCLRKVSVNL